jgi:actin related protein 2/3 complex subunit 1A/1B
VAWSPDQKFLVTGGCDFKCRIFSAFVDGIDSAESDATLTASFGGKSNEFGECLVEFDQAKAWVQGVSWSPSGSTIAFCGHGSTLSFVNLADGNSVQTIYQKGLPTSQIFFKDDDNLVAIGFDHNPTVYTKSGEWAETKKMDEATKKEDKAAGSAASKARNMFQDADTRGKTGGKKDFKEQPTIETKHKNNILCYQYNAGPDFTTSGVDGRIIRWTF